MIYHCTAIIQHETSLLHFHLNKGAVTEVEESIDSISRGSVEATAASESNPLKNDITTIFRVAGTFVEADAAAGGLVGMVGVGVIEAAVGVEVLVKVVLG